METEVSLRIEQFGPALLAGCATTVAAGKSAAAFVKQFRTGGANKTLQALEGRICPKGDIVIWMGGYNDQNNSFTEIPGVLFAPDSIIPEGFELCELPSCTMALCTIKGKTRSLSAGAHNKLLKALKGSGYAADYSLGFSMEYYSFEKYEKDGEEYEFVYMLPCRKL